MSNQNGNAYGLTTLCPIRNGSLSVATEGCPAEASFSAVTRYRLQNLGVAEQSPMARVPNTYLCRFYVLDDVMYQGTPAQYDTLKSSYLVFTSNFHGKLEPWLQGMWNAATGKYKVSATVLNNVNGRFEKRFSNSIFVQCVDRAVGFFEAWVSVFDGVLNWNC